jgi:hypothetical protein
LIVVRHRFIHWGSFPDYIAALGTAAALGAVYIAAREWRSNHAERRASEADQARLIVLEQIHDDAPQIGIEQNLRAVVHNYSGAPVLAVHAVWIYGKNMVFIPGPPDDDGKPVGWKPAEFDIVAAGCTSEPFTMTHSFRGLEQIKLTFTDARGRRWSRVGNAEPAPVFNEGQL